MEIMSESLGPAIRLDKGYRSYWAYISHFVHAPFYVYAYAFGDLLVRGPWITREYFCGEGGDPLADGWFPTGDVATLDQDGFMQITDRSKDVIKSGGEWISSIDLENAAMAHPAVAEAAVIGVAHPKWDERPLLLIRLKEGATATREDMLKFFEGRVAKWWIPDDVVFVEQLPLGATGKVQKNELRKQYGGIFS
jgi:fatty-acyl-CoA synthase